MSASEKTCLLLFGGYASSCIGEWFRTGCDLKFVFESWQFRAFDLLVLAVSYKLYFACLAVAALVYLSTDVPKRYFMVVSAYFLAVPYLSSTAWCTGGEAWRYALADQIVWAGVVVLGIFLMCPAIRPSSLEWKL